MIIATIVGARPQFIKAAVVSRAITNYDGITEVILHTGQHYDSSLSNIFFEELEIPKPDYNLGVGSGAHGFQTGQMLEKLEVLLSDLKPDAVLVYGDTNSTLAGALAAAKMHIPVAHIEAGLRSYNRKMPEEINRILTDHCADLLFTPTKYGSDNLLKEGISAEKIKQVGDVMFDAALFYAEKAKSISKVLKRLKLKAAGYILATLHRAENTDDCRRLEAIVEGFNLVSEEYPVVLPLHPRTRKMLAEGELFGKISDQVITVEPLGYLDMVMLEKNAILVTTDSGGVQKEAYFYKVPCVTLRDETEWVELLETGWNQLCPPLSGETIYEKIMNSIGQSGEKVYLYGDGKAAELIVSELGKLMDSK